MSRARELSRLGNPNIISADSNFNVGFGTATPKEKVNVVGVVSATQFFGDGSTLEGIASAGIGTALSDDKTKALNTIYFTNNEVTVTNNSVVNPPDSGHIAYTQAPTIVVDDTKELTVSDGDDLLVDVLGISTGTNVDYAARGNGVFGNIYVDNIESSGGQTSVNFPKGLVSTGVATFHSDVSIGGTLTYEDVKNIDSVGLITARTGVRISGGGIDIVGDIGLGAGAQTGTAGQVLTSGGAGANATWVDAAGGAEYAGIASGSITAGRAVSVTSDGKLIGVTGSNKINGTSAVAANASGGFNALIYDTTNNKYVMFYVESGNVGKAKVGTPSGTTITWGTAVTFHGNVINNSTGLYDACYDPHNNKCVVFFRDGADSHKGKVCSGTVSGTSITFGTPVTVCSDVMESGTITYCPNANHNYVIAGNDGSNSRTISNVGYNSGTNSSTWDNNVTAVIAAQAPIIDSCWDPVAEKICLVFYNANSTNGSCVAGTLSSNAVTWGSVQIFNSTAVSTQVNIVHHTPSGKNVIVWGNSSGDEYAYAVTATLTGTVFSFGNATQISKNPGGTLVKTKDIGAVYDPVANQIFVAFHDATANVDDGTSVNLTIDGNTITGTNGYVFQTQDGMEYANVSTAYDPDLERVAVLTWDTSNVRYYVERMQSTTVTATNYVGISQASYTNGQTAKISLTGAVNEAVSGLTPATKYYVNADGTFGTNSALTGILAGVALASNRLYIRGW